MTKETEGLNFTTETQMKKIEVFVPPRRVLVSKQVGTDLEDVKKDIVLRIRGMQ